MQLRLPRTIYVLIPLVLLTGGVGAFFAFLKEARHHKTLTAEAPATVTKTEVRHDIDAEAGMKKYKDTIVTYEFEIAGKKYERINRMGKVAASSFASWSKAKVCYDPFNTATIESAELFPKHHVCGE
ncbi:MAG: hypothetical protein AB7Q37_01805 [Pyrinomonadaceae bacterium]